METGAESSAGGAAAAAQSGAHIGMNLFTQAVKAADAAAKTAGGAAKTAASAASDLGEGPFAKAIKAGRRPPDSLVQFLDELHEFHAGMASDIDQAINTSQNYYRPQFAEALQGQAGDALLVIERRTATQQLRCVFNLASAPLPRRQRDRPCRRPGNPPSARAPQARP